MLSLISNFVIANIIYHPKIGILYQVYSFLNDSGHITICTYAVTLPWGQIKAHFYNAIFFSRLKNKFWTFNRYSFRVIQLQTFCSCTFFLHVRTRSSSNIHSYKIHEFSIWTGAIVAANKNTNKLKQLNAIYALDRRLPEKVKNAGLHLKILFIFIYIYFL